MVDKRHLDVIYTILGILGICNYVGDALGKLGQLFIVISQTVRVCYAFDESYIQKLIWKRGRVPSGRDGSRYGRRPILVNPKGKRELQKPAPGPVFSKWHF